MPNRLIDGRDNPIQRTGIYKPIVGITCTILIAFIFYQLGDLSWMDKLSTLIIAFSFTQGALVVVAFTEDWKWRIAGILIALWGTGLAYLFLFLNAVGHTDVNNLAVRSILRSALVSGGVILVLGTWAYLYNRRRGRETEAFLEPRQSYRKTRA